tara:strand:- start:125 stop:979 length:855 start_codon:yes stop_codon:yes gene_type:complete
MIENNFEVVVFGASSLLGKSIIRTNPKNFIYISRKKIDKKNIKWTKLSINPKKKITKNKIRTGIFLISPRYTKKNFNKRVYEKEYYFLKKIFKLYNFSKFVYVSSPTIYQKKHPIGTIKKKCEKFLIKNSKKLDNLQIWRPYNLVGTDHSNLSDHFHNLLFKKIFLQKKINHKFLGCKNDERGYADVDNFIKTLLVKSYKNISFIKNYGNKKSIKVSKIVEIFNKELFKISGKSLNVKFLKAQPNKNIINRKSKNSIFLNTNNEIIFKKYLKKMFKLHKIIKIK